METSVVINEHGRLALPYASLATIEACEHLCAFYFGIFDTAIDHCICLIDVMHRY